MSMIDPSPNINWQMVIQKLTVKILIKLALVLDMSSIMAHKNFLYIGTKNSHERFQTLLAL